MKKLLVLLTGLMLVSSLGVAGVDGDDNSFGFFFDTDATIYTTFTAAPFQAVSGYLVVSNPTSSGVSGWECEVVIPGNGVAYVAPSWAYAGGGLNVFDGAVTGLFNVGVGPGPSQLLPVNGVVVLATFTCFSMSPTLEIPITINPFPGSVTFSGTPGYVDGDDVGVIVACGVSSGYPYGNACAAINPQREIIGNDDMSWSGVKALFN
jgi:hypothetical protein